MIIVRPVTAGDADGLLALFQRAGSALHGMSSLRADRDALAERAAHAEESFAPADSPDPGADYLFVLVDTDSDTIIGTGAVIASVGLVDAFYSYKIVTRIYSSRELGVYNKIPTLVLCNDYTGLTEVASLFVDAAYRSTRAGKLMALSRLLFITEHTERFTETIFAEMRGYHTPDGRVPVWDGLGHHFFSLPFEKADDLTATGNKTFIAELMPSHPIYIPLLSQEAQDAIGQVHDNTVPARRMLEKEGFRFHGYVDIFDGGPTLEVKVTDMRAATASAHYVVVEGNPPPGPDLLIINQEIANYRATLATGLVEGHQLTLTRDSIAALAIAPGDSVRMMELDAPRAVEE